MSIKTLEIRYYLSYSLLLFFVCFFGRFFLISTPQVEIEFLLEEPLSDAYEGSEETEGEDEEDFLGEAVEAIDLTCEAVIGEGSEEDVEVVSSEVIEDVGGDKTDEEVEVVSEEATELKTGNEVISEGSREDVEVASAEVAEQPTGERSQVRGNRRSGKEVEAVVVIK